jgi:hypothetical protein
LFKTKPRLHADSSSCITLGTPASEKDACQDMRTATIALCLVLSACTQFPELKDSVGPDVDSAAFPDLIPLAPTQATATQPAEDPAETRRAFEARVAALRARANALQRQTTDE